MLLVYGREHVPTIAGAKNTAYNIATLAAWWGDKRLSDVTAKNCRAYAATRSRGGARRDLEVLRAAIGYWHREYGPLPAVPAVVMPAKSDARERWLTRAEAARLLSAARHTPHLARFILLGLYTGSRSKSILGLTWEMLDLQSGLMRRRAFGEAEDSRKRAPRVRLGNRILAHLRRWRRLDGPEIKYLCHYDGRRVRKLRRSFPGAVAQAGLDAAVTPHTLRHTRATWLMQAKVDPFQAAGSLGMTVEMLTRTYGHHHPDWQREASEV